MILTNYDGLDLGNILALYEVSPFGSFRVTKGKILCPSRSLRTNLGGTTIIPSKAQYGKHLLQIWFLCY